jgi:predicted O-methyltransferase YrrM
MKHYLQKENENQLLAFARQYWVPCMSWATEQRLVQHLMTWKPQYVCEIWSAIWYSTSRIATTIHTRWWYMYSFEISHPSYTLATHYLYKQHIYNATIYHCNILDTPVHKLCSHKIDLLFIDGAKQEYARYVELLLPFCAPWAHIICDDVLMYKEKVKDLYNLLDRLQLTYTYIPMEENDGILHMQLSN